MRIYILLAHPDSQSFNGALADAYQKACLQKGIEVRRQNLGEMHFDPILWKGYKDIQALEPDLEEAQRNILWCEKWVIFYPVWWGSVPALLKGFFDRALHPGFAFTYHEHDPMWDKLLKGRSAHVISTCDSPWWWIWIMYRSSDKHMMRNATLGFCGFKPVKFTQFGRLKHLTEAERIKHINQMQKLV
jgi:putative NADPH-quinone reductase